MTNEIYHVQFENGEREYFLAVEQCKNMRWKGYRATGNKKPVQTTADLTWSQWVKTPVAEIPRKLSAIRNI